MYKCKVGDMVAVYDYRNDNEYEYEDFVEDIKSAPIIGESFFISGRNLNWMGSDGVSRAESRERLASVITSFHDGRCVAKVTKGTGNTLEAVVYHHDVPSGSVLTVYTTAKAKRIGIYE